MRLARFYRQGQAAKKSSSVEEPDPYVFGPPRSGSISHLEVRIRIRSLYLQKVNSKKNFYSVEIMKATKD
jgi:hypothetical protein